MTVDFYDRTMGCRDDKYAIEVVKEEVARAGLVIDRLKPVTASKHGPYWHYTVPVRQVAA